MSLAPVERKDVGGFRKSEVKMEFPLAALLPCTATFSLFGTQRGREPSTLRRGSPSTRPMTKAACFVTVLRACGELSRIDLPERPGNAGWPTHTPEAQCIGPFAR